MLTDSSLTADKMGIVASRDELVALGKRVGSSPSASGRRVVTSLAGPHQSRFHGPGMEFAEVRAYQPGDDIRTIDWRVTARTGRAHSKIFEAERERPVWFVVDLGASMQFATRGVFKSVAAARAASLLAWQAHRAGEAIGGIVQSPEGSVEDPVGRTRKHLMRFLTALAAGTDVPLGGIAEPLLRGELDWVRGRARTGCRVVVVSDFYGLDSDADSEKENETFGILRSLAQRCELTLVWIYDPLEAEAPPPGRYRVSNGQQSEALVSQRSRSWRESYQQSFEERGRLLRELAHGFRAVLIPLRTDAPPESVLRKSRSTSLLAEAN